MRTSPRIFRSAGIVSLGTLSSRILGLGREMLMARTFGTTAVGSAFVIAFTLPNLLRRLFGEGALSAAFVPAYIRTRDEEGLPAAGRLVRNLCSLLVGVLGLLSLAGMGLATLALMRGGFSGEVRLVLLAGRVLLPYMIGICLAAVMMGVLHSHRKFALPAFTPGLLNVIWIAALLAVHPRVGWSLGEKMMAVSWAILVAGFGQFAVQVPAVRRLGLRAPRNVTPLGPGVRTVLSRMGPAALGAAVTQVNVLIDRTLAFWVAPYGPTALAYSERLIYLPLGLFATALGSILLPEFSGLAHRGERKEIRATLDRGLRGLMFVMVPSAVGLTLLAEPIVALIFQRGEFDAASTLFTARALACYAPGLVVFSAAKVFIPLFHAHGDTQTPVRIGVLAMLANLLLNLLLIFLLPEGWKHAGLALGTVGSSLLQVGVFLRLTHLRYAPIPAGALFRSLLRQLGACLPMAAGSLGVLHLLSSRPPLLAVPAAIGAGALLYFAAARAFRFPELREIRRN